MAAVNLANFQSPGVYVKEVESLVKAIAGVSTSTAGFIGLSTSPSITPGTQKQTDTFTGDGTRKSFELTKAPAKTAPGSYTVKVGADSKAATITESGGKYTLELTEAQAPATGETITVEYEVPGPAPAPNAVLCTSFGEFKIKFPDEVKDTGVWTHLAHGVYGFFNNGGGRCYVICADTVNNALAELATIDEIALVAAPGKTDNATQNALIDHCETQDGIFSRVAILDGARARCRGGVWRYPVTRLYEEVA